MSAENRHTSSTEKEHSCVFCKIVKKNAVSHTVYEADRVIAFLSLEGTPLITPKQHFEVDDLVDGNEEAIAVCGEMAMIAAKLMPTTMRVFNTSSVNFVANFGPNSGQKIEHIHLHLIPRTPGDNRVRISDPFMPLEERQVIAQLFQDALTSEAQVH